MSQGGRGQAHGPSGLPEPLASPLPWAPSLPRKAATNSHDKGEFGGHLFIYYLFFMDDNLEGAGRAAGSGEGAPQPLGTTSPRAQTQLPGLSRDPGPTQRWAVGGGPRASAGRCGLRAHVCLPHVRCCASGGESAAPGREVGGHRVGAGPGLRGLWTVSGEVLPSQPVLVAETGRPQPPQLCKRFVRTSWAEPAPPDFLRGSRPSSLTESSAPSGHPPPRPRL